MNVALISACAIVAVGTFVVQRLIALCVGARRHRIARASYLGDTTPRPVFGPHPCRARGTAYIRRYDGTVTLEVQCPTRGCASTTHTLTEDEFTTARFRPRLNEVTTRSCGTCNTLYSIHVHFWWTRGGLMGYHCPGCGVIDPYWDENDPMAQYG